MIGRLRGLVAEVGEEEALIDVAGVGYVVRCGSRTLGHLPALGEETVLHVESIWSESNGMKLYGFLGRDERRAFVTMLAIQGVGPKLAVRLITELKGKQLTEGPVAAFHAQIHAPAAPPPPSAVGEAVAALLGLGVAEVNARRVVEQAALRLGEDAEIPALIKAGLQELGR